MRHFLCLTEFERYIKTPENTHSSAGLYNLRESGRHFPVSNVALPAHVEDHKVFGVACRAGRDTSQPSRNHIKVHTYMPEMFFFA